MRKAAITGIVLLVINAVMMLGLYFSGVSSLFGLSQFLLKTSNKDDRAALYLRFVENTDAQNITSVAGFLTSMTPNKLCLWSYDGLKCYVLNDNTKYDWQGYCDQKQLDKEGVVWPLSEWLPYSDWSPHISKGGVVAVMLDPLSKHTNIKYVYADGRNYQGNCK